MVRGADGIAVAVVIGVLFIVCLFLWEDLVGGSRPDPRSGPSVCLNLSGSLSVSAGRAAFRHCRKSAGSAGNRPIQGGISQTPRDIHSRYVGGRSAELAPDRAVVPETARFAAEPG